MKRVERLIVALDLGSSGVKAAAATPNGRPLSVCRLPAPVVRPPGGSELAREFDIPLLRRTVGRALAACLREAGGSPSKVAGIGVTSQREAIVLLDRAGVPLYAGPNNDLRAAFQGAAIDDAHATAIWNATGHLPSFMLAWSKLLWFREEAPDLYRRATHVTSLADWLIFELTGELKLERSLGVEAGLVEVDTGRRATRLAARLGFEEVGVPDIVAAGQVIGLTRPARDTWHRLPAGVPVVNAGPDTQAALLGMGVIDPGQTGIVAGWSGVVQRVTSQSVRDPARGLWTGRHAAPDRFTVEGNAGVMGGAYQWLVGLTCGSDSAAFAKADRLAMGTPRSAGSVSAHLGPAAVNMSRSSLRTGGFIFPVPLALETPGAGHLCRAAIENFGFAFRSNLEMIDSLLGHAPAGAYAAVGGGMVRSKAFRRVLTDVLPAGVRFGHPDSSLLGAISQVAVASGHTSLTSAAVARRRACRRLAPDAAAVREYDQLYAEWRHRGDILAQIGL